MDLSYIRKKIDSYLGSTRSAPLIVDLQTRADLEELTDYYSTAANDVISASEFCGSDSAFKLDEFTFALSGFVRTTFITGLSAYLKLLGDRTVRDSLKTIVSKNYNAHIVVLTYQCREFLQFSDPRIMESGKVLICDGEPDPVPAICLISKNLAAAYGSCYFGFEQFEQAAEHCADPVAYIATTISKNAFPDALFQISQMNNSYDVICRRDHRTYNVSEDIGTPKQWDAVLERMGENGTWNDIVSFYFGSQYALSGAVRNYLSFDETKKWYYFVALLIFGAKDNAYLDMALKNAEAPQTFFRSLYRTILTVDADNASFPELYQQRKSILSSFVDATDETIDYCKVVAVKERNAIRYLTDLTQPEREKIIDFLDKYGSGYSTDELRGILENVYPDLAAYLAPFRMRNDFLESYFADYKYQKLVNRILPSFEQVVDDQAVKHDFLSMLTPRSSCVDKIDVTGAQAFFVDALGAEYLGFIQAKCEQYGLSVLVRCCRAELPTLTCYNKDFVETFMSKGCPVADIKGLDEIKHHGENNFDYEKVKIPVYIIKELQIIDDLLKKIKIGISTGAYSKGIIASDHGASRLAVLHDTETTWGMSTDGEHSGRCCKTNEVDFQPEIAVESEGYWALANYDRFRGGRRANVEVHGGATLEEVTVPIIEITMKQGDIEAFIIAETRILTLGAKEHAVIKIYVGIKSSDFEIALNGKYYSAVATENENIYSVDLPDVTKKGIYYCDIVLGSDVIAARQKFEIKKKGWAENDLF